MFDAKYLDGIARNYVLAIAERKLGVSKKMIELLDWEYMKMKAEAGEWTISLKPRAFAELYTQSLIESGYQIDEIRELTESQPEKTGWAEHFNGFIDEMKNNGYNVEINWEMLGKSKYDFPNSHFLTVYESKRKPKL